MLTYVDKNDSANYGDIDHTRLVYVGPAFLLMFAFIQRSHFLLQNLGSIHRATDNDHVEPAQLVAQRPALWLERFPAISRQSIYPANSYDCFIVSRQI